MPKGGCIISSTYVQKGKGPLMKIPVAKEAFTLAILLAILALFLIRIHLLFSAVIFIGMILVLLFFRDPKRWVPQGSDQVMSPADGRVLQIVPIQEGDQMWKLLSIFMSPLNVHINYAPIQGRVIQVDYKKGSFLRADHVLASFENESNMLIIQNEKTKVKMKQIAGIFARRIICYIKSGDLLKTGQKVGLIQFGSRVDLYLPESIDIKVKVGDKVKGSETILGVIR